MPDNLTPSDRLRTMRSVRSQKTGPERRVRAMLAGLGLRGWLVNPLNIPGRPDFAFPERKAAIFVDGCFWHGCPVCKRPLPQTNHTYWENKIQRNVDRDTRYITELEALGWKVLRIWEHELKNKKALDSVRRKITVLLEASDGISPPSTDVTP